MWLVFAGVLAEGGRPLRPEGSLSASTLEDLLGQDARLPYLKSLPVSHCVPYGRAGVRTMGTHWHSFAAALWANLASISRHGWRRFLGQALSHHLCRDQPWQVCADNAGYCTLGCLSAHLTLLLSAPNAYRLDEEMFIPHKVPGHLWDQIGISLGYFLWNPTGFTLLDLLYSGWPIFGLLRQLRGQLSRLESGEVGDLHYLHRARRMAASEGRPGETMARIACVFQPNRPEVEGDGCAVLEAEKILQRAEEMLMKEKDSIWQSRQKHLAFEELMATADQQLRRLVEWFQAPGEGFRAPGARLAAGVLISADAVLPRLERLQRHLRRWTSQESKEGLCGSSLSQQGALVAEASYVQRLFSQLERPHVVPISRPLAATEAWVTFLWGGHGKAEDGAWIYGEAIRTLAHSVRRVEGRARPFLVLTVGHVPKQLLEELDRETLTVIPVETNQTRPPWISEQRSAAGWFEERGLAPVFPQLAAWTLPFQRVVILDADTLVLENCEELFDLGVVPFASGYEMHQEQLDISRHDGSRTYMLNAGVMTLRPDPEFLQYMRAVAATDAFRGRLQHYAEGSFPTFQQFLDIFLLEVRSFLSLDIGSGRHQWKSLTNIGPTSYPVHHPKNPKGPGLHRLKLLDFLFCKRMYCREDTRTRQPFVAQIAMSCFADPFYIFPTEGDDMAHSCHCDDGGASAGKQRIICSDPSRWQRG